MSDMLEEMEEVDRSQTAKIDLFKIETCLSPRLGSKWITTLNFV